MLAQQYRTYIDLDRFGERYEMQMPVLSAHNLVIGNTYADIGGKMTITKVAKPDGTKVDDNGEMCILNFRRSGLFTAQSFQVKGEVTRKQDKES
jgi:Oxysterol-binding protein